MTEKIRIDLVYVRDLHDRVSDTAERLRGHVGNVDGVITSDGDVEGTLHDFMNKWDKRRRQVADTLDAVVSALHAIDDSFTKSDDKMAAQITDGGS